MLYKATRPEFCWTQMLHLTLERLALSLMPTKSWSTKNLIASFPIRFWNLLPPDSKVNRSSTLEIGYHSRWETGLTTCFKSPQTLTLFLSFFNTVHVHV